MSGSNQGKKNTQKTQKTDKTMFIIVGLITVLVLGFIVIKGIFDSEDKAVTASGDLEILKSEVSEIAKFYPYKAGKTEMEVLAVKASDGTIRTAFNTCQVCFASGRGYYEQEGDELVCQNCGNRFQLDQVEKIKGGCNPVPIMEGDKTDDGTKITISQAFLEANAVLFGNWKK